MTRVTNQKKRRMVIKLLQQKNRNSISQCLVNQTSLSIMEQHLLHLKNQSSVSAQEIHPPIMMVNRNSILKRMNKLLSKKKRKITNIQHLIQL